MTLLRELGREQAFAKIGVYGFAGGGKSWTAALFAIGLAQMIGADRVAWFETENGSDYVKPRLFDPAGLKIMVAKSRAFQDLLTFIEEVEDSEIKIAVVDSLTHVWVELMAAYKKKKRVERLEFQHFAEVKAEWGRFSEAFIGSRCHLIVCGRAGYEYDFFEEEKDGGGTRKVLEKTGIKMKAEGEFSYEPSLVIRMEREKEFDEDDNKQRVRRIAHVEKDRFDVIDGKEFVNPSFKDILPHVELLNLGGEHVGPDFQRTSADLITDRDRSVGELNSRRKVALDEIQATLVQAFPSATAPSDKRAKIEVIEEAFKVKGWAAVERKPLEELEGALIPESVGGVTKLEGLCIRWKEKTAAA